MSASSPQELRLEFGLSELSPNGTVFEAFFRPSISSSGRRWRLLRGRPDATMLPDDERVQQFTVSSLHSGEQNTRQPPAAQRMRVSHSARI